MEKITKIDGKVFYGQRECRSCDDAYRLFREDYHESLGKAYYRRLNMPAREERIHWSGINVTQQRYEQLERQFASDERIACRIMGFLGIGYCRMVGIWDMPDFDECDADDYLEWLFVSGSRALKYVGRGDSAGRTSKRKNTRYR